MIENFSRPQTHPEALATPVNVDEPEIIEEIVIEELSIDGICGVY